MTLYTVAQAAEMLHMDPHALSNKLRRHNYPKLGDRYVLTEEDIERLKDHSAGRRKKEKEDDRLQAVRKIKEDSSEPSPQTEE